MSRRHWDDVAGQRDGLPDGWRRHARAAHVALFREWVGRADGRWLKTDTAEESRPARALLPQIPEADWYGVDVSYAALRGAAGCLRAQADVRRLPFADATFAGVLSTSTLDHFDDPADIDVSLAELRRVLRPGGMLLLTLDNPANPLVRLRNALPAGVRSRTGLAPFHVGPTLGADDGTGALMQAGFRVERVGYLLHAPHIVGTRLARFALVEQRLLPALDRRLGAGRRAARSGHFVAFLATATGAGR